MAVTLNLISLDLANWLEPMGFIAGVDDIFRIWNLARDVCCAVAAKELGDSGLFTVEVGFISPQILEWSGISPHTLPKPYEANGFGIFYRLDDLFIDDSFVSPPGGWSILTTEDRVRFNKLLESQFAPNIASLLQQQLTWDGWIQHFQEEVHRFPCGRGRAWAMLGYSLLASPDRTISEIEKVIEKHARQDGSKKAGNRVDSDIARQKELLRNRESDRD